MQALTIPIATAKQEVAQNSIYSVPFGNWQQNKKSLTELSERSAWSTFL